MSAPGGDVRPPPDRSVGAAASRTRRGSLRRAVALAAVLLVVLPHAALSLESTDPRRSQLWWFDTLGVEQAWDVTRGAGVTVAVLDTGVDPTHPDLADRLAPPGTDLIDRDDDPRDPNGHGTIVSGLAVATANNDEGIAGVAPEASLLAVRVLDESGRGEAGVVDAGIRWAVDNGADVINLSLEVEETEGGPDPELTAPNDAIEYAWENGVVVVAATGNSGGGVAGYRDGSPVVLVGAVDQQDRLEEFSDANRLDAVMAPGQDMVSTWCAPDGAGGCRSDARYGIGSGTSFAAPVAAGVVALLLAAGLDHAQAVQVLRETAVDLGDPGPDAVFGVGRVDAAAAMAAAGSILAADAPAEEPAADGAAPEAAPSDGATAASNGDGAEAPVTEEQPGAADPATADDQDQLAADGAGTGGTDELPPALTGLALLLVVLAGAGTLREARASATT